MANRTIESFPLGWQPSQDANNGDVRGLLRMDNLTLDDQGIVSLVKGTENISGPHAAHVTDLFSVTHDSTKFRFAALFNGHVLGNGTTIFTGGSWRTAFGSALGQTLICSGGEKKKFDVNSVLRDLGITPPSNPPSAVSAQPSFFDFNPVVGGVVPTSTLSYNSATETAFDEVGGIWNTLVTSTGPSHAPENDVFKISFRVGNTKDLVSAKVVFCTDTAKLNYFHYTWQNGGETPFNLGLDRWSTLQCRRGDFQKVGDESEGWDAITSYHVSLQFLEGASSASNVYNSMRFIGGTKGQLNGWYDYVQVNVYNSGLYEGKSAMGPVLSAEYVENGYMEVTPQDPSDSTNINEVWIYRRSRPAPDEFREHFPTGVLDKFYRVKVLTLGNFGMFEDTMSDRDALILGITLNENLLGVRDCGKDIFGIEGLYYDRMLFLAQDELFVGDRLNIDAVDVRFSVKLSGDPSEKYLWITKVTNGVLLLATSRDLYELAGTFSELPDGTIDLTIRAMGEAHPPVGEDFAKSEGAIFYSSADGWRVTRGSNSELLSHDLRFLWQDEVRHNFQPVAILSNNNARIACAVAYNHLFTCMPLQDGTRWMMVYDLVRKNWHVRKLDPFILYTEDDGTLLGGFGGGSGNYVRELNTGDDLSGVNGQDIYLLTTFDDFELPRNRKDVFTFKINVDTGGDNISLAIAKNGSGVFTSIGTINSNGKGERLITIAETVGLAKSYALLIQGTDLTKFKLYNFTIEYEPRPEQLTYLRIPYTNLGTQSRKRFINFAFVLDTLGEDCEFFPLIDGVIAGSTSIVNFDRKATHIHYFFPTDSTADQFVGTDIGGILCGFFEFYGVNLDEIVSEKLPVPTKFLLIPSNDYGVPNRKRHSSYKFQINTRGYNVQFTPRLDGVWQTAKVYNTTHKQTVEYFFTADTFGIDIGGRLESLASQPFEFYGVIKPQTIEVMPDRLLEFRIPENNYGIGAKKRIRTMPMEINTNGQNVTFTPIVDNVRLSSSTLNTPNRTTAFHYFSTDVFGVDFSGELVSDTTTPFEFNGLLKPEGVEALPVAKKFDQIGPFRFDKLGTLHSIRIRAIFGDAATTIKVLNEMEATLPNSSGNAGEWSTIIPTFPNKDEVYEISVPKTVNGTVFRIEIGPATVPFHRYDVQIKVNLSGMDSTPRWVSFR
jgi:hypothetical protein